MGAYVSSPDTEKHTITRENEFYKAAASEM